MKATIRVPLEAYEFIEIEVEGKTLHEIKQISDEMKMLVSQEVEGHNVKEWAEIRNKYLETGEIEIEDLEGCNKWQKLVINEIKKTFKKFKNDN